LPDASHCHTSTTAPLTGVQLPLTLTMVIVSVTVRPLLPSVMSRRKYAELPIIPVRSGYGPSVSDGVMAHVDDPVPVVVVVAALVVVLGLVDDDAHAEVNAAPTPAPSAASSSRRSSFGD